MTRKRQRCMFPPEGAETPASRIFLTNAGGTESGFNRRIERVVCMISNRTETSSDMTPSADQALDLTLAGYRGRCGTEHVQRLRKPHPIQRLPRSVQPDPHSREMANGGTEPGAAGRHRAYRQGSRDPAARRRNERVC